MAQDPDAVVVDAMWSVVVAGGDFADWLAAVLARVAARAGSIETVLAGRPGSWEADLVRRLLAGTVGYDGQYLADYGSALPRCVNWHEAAVTVALAAVVRPAAGGGGEVGASLCAECAGCVAAGCGLLGVVMDEEYEESWCAEHAAQFIGEEAITGPEIVPLDSDRYRHLTTAGQPEAGRDSAGGER